MKLRDTLWLGLKGIMERKVRTALTVLTVVIGIAAIVSLVSLVTGLSTSITHSLASIGPSSIFMVPSQNHIFTDADVAEIESLPNVSKAIPIIRSSGTISINGQTLSVDIVGISNASLPTLLGGLNLYEGTSYNGSQLPMAVVGHDIAFPTTTQTLPSITIGSPIYLVQQGQSGSRSITLLPSGILQTYGSSLFVSPDTTVFIPIQEAQILLSKYSYSAILVQATNTTTATPLYNLLDTIYGNSASILSVQQIAATVSSITGSLTIFLGSIGGISLIVAGISILSIMMVSVTERTREIGILKSIGFKKREILMLFLAEAVIIGLLGGIMGVAVGAAGSYLLPSILSGGGNHASPQSSTPQAAGSNPSSGSGARSGGGHVFVAGGSSSSPSASSSPSSPQLSPIITPSIVVSAILIAVVVSVLASLYPAWKASTVDPIKALRSE